MELFEAVKTGDAEALAALLEGNRGQVAARDANGWTPLHLAAFYGHEAAVRALLNKGAEVNALSDNPLRNTPLHAAAAGKHAGIAKLLVERGANVDFPQHSGWAPLHAAAQHGDMEMARALIDAGADPGVRADNAQRPIDLALLKGHQEMVEFLESNGGGL